MDDLLEAVGAEPVQWPYKTECCGAALSMTSSQVVGRLSHKLLSMAREAGAECVAVACPLCQVNLDLRQPDAKKAHGDLPDTPVFYVTQLVGLALGLAPKDIGLEAHAVGAGPLLEKSRAPSMDETT
jgi:heterodisulfide reductase subunit B